MSAGNTHILAQKSDGTLWGWGGYAIGNGGTPSNSAIPLKVSTDRWIDFTTGHYNSAGIKEDGTLWTWGVGSRGELGLGDTLDYLFPTQVGTDNDWVSVQAGAGQPVMAIKNDGTVWYWGGSGYWGEYGNGVSLIVDLQLSPVQTMGICVDISCEALGIDLNWDVASNALVSNLFGVTRQWLNCSDNSLIPGESGMSFTPSVSGHYAVIVSKGICVDTSACVFVETVGIGELGLGDKAFYIHPNPAKDVAFISYDLASNNSSLEVYDLLGRSLYKQELIAKRGELRLDISGFVSGVYIVLIRQENGVVLQRRLVVE